MRRVHLVNCYELYFHLVFSILKPWLIELQQMVMLLTSMHVHWIRLVYWRWSVVPTTLGMCLFGFFCNIWRCSLKLLNRKHLQIILLLKKKCKQTNCDGYIRTGILEYLGLWQICHPSFWLNQKRVCCFLLMWCFWGLNNMDVF